MKKRSSMFIRVTAELMALLLALLSLPVVPVQAAPEETAEDHDDISVLSITVNVNTETGLVFTELILKNASGSYQDITYALPEISAGIDLDTLTVKTSDGSEIEAVDGRVPLRVKGLGFAGITYTYKTKKNLAYEGAIGIDLRQLSRQFNDRIGHLEWTVDMPAYEFILVNDIQPGTFTVNGHRICVELDQFMVSRLLNRVSLSRTTHTDLMEELVNAEERLVRDKEFMEEAEKELDAFVEKYEIDNDNMSEMDDDTWQEYEYLSDRWMEYSLEFEEGMAWCFCERFLLENYRKWYRDPEWVRDHWINLDYSFNSYLITLLNMYYDQEGRKEDREALLKWIEDRRNPDVSKACTFDQFIEEHPLSIETIPELPNLQGSRLEYCLFYDRLLYYLFYDLHEDGNNGESWLKQCPAFEATLNPVNSIYALLPSAPGIEGTGIYFETGWDCETTHRVSESIEVSLGEVLPGGRRFIHLFESDFDDPEMVQDYLTALNVKAVIRVQILREDSALAEIFEGRFYSPYSGATMGNYEQYFGYDASGASIFDDILYEEFKARLSEVSSNTLVRCKEPLKELLSIPIFTQYWGEAYGEPSDTGTVNVDPYEFSFVTSDNLDTFMMELYKNAKLQEGSTARQNLVRDRMKEINDVRRQLNLPTPEQMGVPAISEEPTEAPVEETSEEPTETLTETTAEASTEAPTEAVTEATAEVSTEESAAAVSSEEETFASKDTKDPTDKGPLVLLIAIVAGVVVVGAATTAVVVKKKSKK